MQKFRRGQAKSPPRPTRTKLPGIVPKLVMDKAITKCGDGTRGLGDRCHTAAVERVAVAYEDWLAYKKSMPDAPRGAGSSRLSPRERYRAQDQHAAAIERFEAKQRVVFEQLHREKKAILQAIAAQRSEQHDSQFAVIQQEREERRERLEAYAIMKAEHAREEKLLAEEIANIWRESGREADAAWAQWISLRKEKLDEDKNEFARAQRERAERRCEAAEELRRAKTQLANRIERQRDVELRERKANVAELRKSFQEDHIRAKYMHEEKTRRATQQVRDERQLWDARRNENKNKRLQLYASSHVHHANESCTQASLNAFEESILAKQRAADAIRAWKRSKKDDCADVNSTVRSTSSFL